MAKRSTDNTMAKRSTDNTMAKRSTDNTMAKRSTDNTMAKRSTDNTMAKGKKGQRSREHYGENKRSDNTNQLKPRVNSGALEWSAVPVPLLAGSNFAA